MKKMTSHGQKADPTKPYRCPHCERALYDRAAKRCGYCGAETPTALQFSPEEMRAIEAQREKWKAASSHGLSLKKPERGADGSSLIFSRRWMTGEEVNRNETRKRSQV